VSTPIFFKEDRNLQKNSCGWGSRRPARCRPKNLPVSPRRLLDAGDLAFDVAGLKPQVLVGLHVEPQIRAVAAPRRPQVFDIFPQI